MTSPHKSCKVLVGEKEYEEFTFSCSSRNYKTGEITQFHISQKYGYDGEVPESNPEAPCIRFVFVENEKKQFVASALAEEPAQVSSYAFKNKLQYTTTMESLMKIRKSRPKFTVLNFSLVILIFLVCSQIRRTKSIHM